MASEDKTILKARFFNEKCFVSLINHGCSDVSMGWYEFNKLRVINKIINTVTYSEKT